MNILILGSGGREHAITWKLKQSERNPQLFVAPGNGGTAQIATNVDIDPMDFEAVGRFCLANDIQMVVVGPENPLVGGIYDHFKSSDALEDIIITGPSAQGAQLEGSKAFAKAFMQRHQIPTAAYREFDKDHFDEGIAYIRSHSLPIVLKADGLAAGKGVVICASHDEAVAEFEAMIHNLKFGDAGKKVVIEEFLEGIELSVFVGTDGDGYVLLPEAKDYKNIGEGDTGLNTGGMGAVSPVPFATPDFMEKVTRRIIEPTIQGLKAEKIDYKGFIFFGLIKVGNDPYVIEYNCRLGDPETEVILLRLENDLISILEGMHRGTLSGMQASFAEGVAITTMVVSGGYPEKYQKGLEMHVDSAEKILETLPSDVNGTLFHAGTTRRDDTLLTNGGRVIACSVISQDFATSQRLSQEVASAIDFENKYFRTDIGYEFG